MSLAPVQPYGKISREITNSLKPMARALLMTITANINRHTNQLEHSLNALALLAGMSKDSVIKYTRMLEAAGHIKVKRQPGGKHDDVNVYSLSGQHAEIALYGQVVSADRTGRLNRDDRSEKSTAQVGEIDTDYIDLKESNLEEEDSDNDFSFSSNSDTGEYDLQAEGEDTTLTEQDAPLRRIEILGITGTALEAAKLYPQRIDQAFAIAATTKDIRDMPSFISRILINGAYVESPSPSASAASAMGRDLGRGVKNTDHISETPAEKQTKFAEFTGYSWADFANSSDNISDITPAPPESLDARNWKVTYWQLEATLDKASFQTLLKKAQYCHTEPDGTFVVSVHNQYAQDYMQHRLYRNVRRTLSDVIGKPTEIRFIVQSEVSVT